MAEAFYLTGDIEKYGNGFIRIRKEIESYPTMCFDFNEIPNGFLVELNYKDQKISSEKRNERINERINALTENERSILEAIEKNPRITQAQLAENLNLTE